MIYTPIIMAADALFSHQHHWPFREMKLNEELTFEDVVVKFFPRKSGHVASVRSADWAIEAFARDIRWSAITGKKQIDFTISPLRNPLSPAPNGNIIAPHGEKICCPFCSLSSSLPIVLPRPCLLSLVMSFD